MSKSALRPSWAGLLRENPRFLTPSAGPRCLLSRRYPDYPEHGAGNRQQNGRANRFPGYPGFHISEKRFNLKLRDLVTRALADADLVVYLVDATREPGPEEEAMAAALKGIGRPLVAALNKIDHAEAVPDRAASLSL